MKSEEQKSTQKYFRISVQCQVLYSGLWGMQDRTRGRPAFPEASSIWGLQKGSFYIMVVVDRTKAPQRCLCHDPQNL